VMDLSQYRLEPIRKDGEFVLYRCVPQSEALTSAKSILALSPIVEHPAPATVKKIEHELSLKDDLDPGWAVRPIALSQQQSRIMLLFEDPNAESLDRLAGRPLELREFLRCGIALAASLGQVHRRGFIHKDIKPSNVFANAAMDHAWLTGFGIASRLSSERRAVEPAELIAGTLAYMAPEQTGRMNRSVDARSDLYAFGVVLYELLTGSLPFTASDPMEWVHCHIARQPLPPAERLGSIPQSVSAIIVKLLAKTPEQRYQTVAGVESDLRRCLEDWDREGIVHDFALGQYDRPERLLISEKLYGREHEVDTLLASFDSVVKSGRPELVLVCGYSGIGKSSVVNELRKVLVPPRGLFASGKFDQLKRDIPYFTVAQALQILLRQLLSKPEAELSRWRDQLRKALDPNGALVTDLIPELKFIIGEQPTVPDVTPAATKARFQMAMQRLIGVFAREEHPLALFLDDLQWLDTATMDLLESILVESEIRHLLLVGAYRDNEVDAAHPLIRKLSALRRSGSLTHELVLKPLTSEDLTHWLADAFQELPERVRALAQVVHDKTAGNPFFANQLLQELVEKGLVTFDTAHPGWRWDIGPIQAKGYSNNVVELMVGKLDQLPLTTQEALKKMAYLGHTANVSTLAMIYGTSEEELHSHLREALRLELIARSDNAYEFVHDRVQEAAYSLVPEEQRAPEHLRIGRLLATHISPDKREEAVFEIVGHFNRATPLQMSQEEREKVAALNLMAGKRAKKAAAYASALNYLTAGAELVAAEEWRRHDLVFELELHRSECEFVTGEVVSAEKRLTMLSSISTSITELAAVVCLQAELYFALEKYERGVSEGAEFLRKAGFPIPLRPAESEARAAYDRICSRLDGVGIDGIAALPLLTDQASRAILDVFTKLSASAASVDKNFNVLIICSAVELTLDRGVHDASCWAFTVMGYLAAWMYGNFEAAFRFGELGYELIERTGLRRFEGYVCLIFSTLLMPWAKHVTVCRPVIRRAFESAYKNGDLQWAAASENILLSNLLLAGDSLADVEEEAEASLAFCQKNVFSGYTDTVRTQAALIRNLRGLTRQFGVLDDQRFDEFQIEKRFESQPNLLPFACWYWIRKLQARFLAGDFVTALEVSRRAQDLLVHSPGMLERVEHEFYSGLTHAALCGPLSSAEGREHLEAMVAHHRQLETWARHCPENFENRAALIAAEIARVGERDSEAMRLYEHAIRSARESGFIHSEALAMEIASRFYADRGFDKIAKMYLRDARFGYQQWGADGKVLQLDQLYPDLKQEQATSGPTSTITAPVERLDLATVIRVSQTISSEIVLEKLFDTVMRKAMEHAGAERGLLIAPRGDELQIEAESRISGNDVIVSLGGVSIAGADMPESILRYVMRTHESVILDDALSASSFSADPYFLQRHVRSILCLPLLNQAKLTGILYLENNLAPCVFTPDRITVLRVLVSQAAISLENTRLYRDLEDREAKIRRLVDANILGIVTWDVNGAILETNEAYLRMLQYDQEEVTSGRVRWWDMVPPDWRERTERALAEVMQTGTIQPFETEMFRKDGTRVPVLVGATLFQEGGKDGLGFVLDLSPQKRAEAEIRALKDQLYKENLALRDEVEQTSMFDEIVGTSNPLNSVLSRIAKVAPTDSSVLVTGETGTGKELIARAIHRKSQRAGRAFVSVNCAAIPRDLILSELFGHEKGAFTGAAQRRLGRFELADGGTIFLDEVGELLPDTQVALLRVLQERELERVGGGQPIHVDVRVIAATNRDLEAAVANGTFRQDLFYRLNVFPIEVPPLRERKDDVQLLVEYFVQRYGVKAGKNIRSIEKRTLDLLQSYDWPGNIRELQNVIERSVILSAGDVFSVDELWLSKRSGSPAPAVKASPIAMEQVASGQLEPPSEREIIEAALAATRGRVSGVSGAAAKLGIPPSTLEARIKALKINKLQFKFR
jgi:PAS domain S-box-containing protein